MARHLSEREEVDIVRRFTVGLEPAISLADQYQRTRQAIYKTLRKHGVEPAAYGRLTVTCTACGEPFELPRGRVRNRKRIFCSRECYWAYIEGMQQGEYVGWRHGSRIARIVVSNHFDLKPGHIVHHEDRNNRNNSPENLRVFASQGDHIRYHRLGADYATPIWNGATDI